MSIADNPNIILSNDELNVYIKNTIKRTLASFTNYCNNPDDENIVKTYFFFLVELYNLKTASELQNYLMEISEHENYYNVISKIILKLHGSSTTYKLIHTNLSSDIFYNENEYYHYKLNCKKNGGFISNENKNNIRNIRKKINETEKYIVKFIETINTTNILTYKNDLEGISEEILNKIYNENENMNNVDYKLYIKLTKKFYNECMSFLKNSIVRKKINMVLNSFFSKLSYQIISLLIYRHELSKYMELNNFCELVSTYNIIQYPNIYSNILQISSQLNNKYFDEYASICKVNTLNYWDIYYSFNILKEKININENNIREYFPLSHVFQYILNLYQILFDIKIQKNESSDFIFHDSYMVSNNNNIIGYLNINFFVDNIDNGELKVLNFNYTTFFLLTNYKERLFKKHILLYTSDIINLMREFGCIFIHMLQQTTHGVLTQKEIPNVIANIFELLFWNRDIIKYLSSHYVNTQKLPDAYYNKLMKIKNIDMAFNYKHLCFVSLYDYFIHNNDNFYNLCKKIIHTSNEHTDKQSIKELIILEELYKKLFDKIYNVDGISIIHNICYVPTSSNFHVGKNVGLYYRILFDSILALKIYQREFTGKINKNIGMYIINIYNNFDNILSKYDLSITDKEINYFNNEYDETKKKSESSNTNIISDNDNDDNFSIIESIAQASESSEYLSDYHMNRLNYFYSA